MNAMDRRFFLKALGLSALAGGSALAAPIHDGSKIIEAGKIISRGGPAVLEDGKVVQPRREIPIFRENRCARSRRRNCGGCRRTGRGAGRRSGQHCRTLTAALAAFGPPARC